MRLQRSRGVMAKHEEATKSAFGKTRCTRGPGQKSQAKGSLAGSNFSALRSSTHVSFTHVS